VRLKNRSKKYLLMEDSEEEDDVFFNAEAGHAKVTHMNNPDEEFEGEFGYSLIKALRGKTVGRRLKRNLFKFGFITSVCSFSLLVITVMACKSAAFFSHSVVLCYHALCLPYLHCPLCLRCLLACCAFL
jgi:hypothetical protein